MSLDLEAVHSEMLAAIDDRYQKTPGFPAWDFTRAFALAVVSLSEDVETAEAHLNLENLTGAELDTWIQQHRGLERKYATYAGATLRIVSGSGTISIEAGDLFATESGVEFQAVSDGDYEVGDTFTVRAAVGGVSGNVAAGTITKMPVTIAGLAAVTNDAAAAGGYDAESDDDYRVRYYDDLANPNNGANKAAYIAWATAVPGVGRAKCFAAAGGAGTVEVCILDADMAPAGAALIAAVQAVIDPNGNGDGSGTAPIGAVCTVTTGTSLAVNVTARLTLADGATLAAAKASIEAAAAEYLRSIAFLQGYVSYGQIGQCVATADGVLDYADLRLAGSTANLPVGDRQTPVLGTTTFTEG